MTTATTKTRKEKGKTAKGKAPRDRDESTPYHVAAFVAICYSLREYTKSGDVTLEEEHLLSKGSLKIDAMIIKKNRDLEIKNSWGKIFRGHNVVEYKSPVAPPLSVFDFNKVHGYAGIYSSQTKTEFADMTVTMICHKKPDELFRYLRTELNYKIVRKDRGVYYVSHKGRAVEKSLAVQIVVYSEFTDEDVLLKALRPNADETVIKKAAELTIHDNDALELLSKWWDAVTMINWETLSKMEGDMPVKQVDGAFLRLMIAKGRLAEFKQEWKQEAKQEIWQEAKQEAWQEATKTTTQQIFGFLESGHSLEEAKARFQVAR